MIKPQFFIDQFSFLLVEIVQINLHRLIDEDEFLAVG